MSKLARVIENGWSQRGLTACLLYPVALIFALLTALRRQLYASGIFRSVSLPVPVIVIGNITVGGSGKTPLAIALIEALRGLGYQPGVVSRGYGGSHENQSKPPRQVLDTQAEVYGDEAVLIARKTGVPIFVGRDRALAAQQLLKQYPMTSVIVCDDGLQHYGLGRDIEIAVFDTRGISNGWPLPAGPLREPVSRLQRVDAVVLNGKDAIAPALPSTKPQFRMQLLGFEAYRLQQPNEHRSLKDFAGLNLLAAAGIGHPQRFFDMLHAAGLGFSEFPLPDHFDFHENPFEGDSSRSIEAILITEKDAVKCAALKDIAHDSRIWVVPVRAELDPRLIEWLDHRLKLHQLKFTEKPLGPSPA